MNVLYYLEPSIELGNPTFRLGTVRNHLEHEITSLQKSNPDFKIKLLLSDAVYTAARSEGLLEKISCIVINQEDYTDKFPQNIEFTKQLFHKNHTPTQTSEIKKYIKNNIKSFRPNTIIVYEGTSTIIQECFPQALVLNSSLGIFSRAPFPETSCLDPSGLFSYSFLNQYGKTINETELSPEKTERLSNFKNTFKTAIKENNIIPKYKIRQGFEKVLLLPLQVSGYFAFDANIPDELNINSQLDLIKYTLNHVPDHVGVYVTLHGAELGAITDHDIAALRDEFPNFLFDADVQKVRWCSQFVMEHVDGVVCVTSSLGLQSMIWDIPTFVIGSSHFSSFSFSGLEHCEEILDFNDTNNDAILYYLLTHYYPLTKDYHHNGEWMGQFLRRSLNKFKSSGINIDFFEPIEKNDEDYFEILNSQIRYNLMHEELERFSTHMFGSTVKELSIAKSKIDQHDIISFDVFDTLLTRNVLLPNSLFDLISIAAEKIFLEENIDLKSFGGFRNLRERAANRVKRATKDSEEIDYKAIYEEIRHLTNLSKQATLTLRKLELQYEHKSLSPRLLGQQLFEYALKANKTIIIVSDMYLPENEIVLMLKRNNFTQYEKIYVSSSYGKLKKSGTLFTEVRLDYPHQSILHFGDNYTADIKMPLAHQIDSFHLPIINDYYRNSALFNQNIPWQATQKGLGESLMHGVISRKFYDNHHYEDSCFNGDAYMLGYQACGPIILGFARWLLQQALRDGIDDLYFLARDGKIVQEVYDKILATGVKGPRSHYMMASRRCYNTAGLKTEQDLLDSVSLSFSQVPLDRILMDRYGVSVNELKPDTLKACDLSAYDQIINIKRKSQLNRFKKCLSHNREIILAKAKQEREALLKYLDQMGMNTSSKKSIVDIGHNATLQQSLGRMLNTTNIGGYYFVTYHPAEKVVREGFDVKGYLIEFEDNKLSTHPYCQNIGMFEFLFLTNDPSFKRFRLENNEPIGEFVEGDESSRFTLVNQVHNGVRDYVDDVLKASQGNFIEAYDISKNHSCQFYLDFLSQPYYKDAHIFNNVSFVDAFGGSDTRYLIASPKYPEITADNYAQFVIDSWWREGAQIIAQGPKFRTNTTPIALPRKPALPPKPAHPLIQQGISIVSKIDKHLPISPTSKRKLRKLLRDPQAFFEDSQYYDLLKRFM
jgi:predicted HAD superfamily hydrolase